MKDYKEGSWARLKTGNVKKPWNVIYRLSNFVVHDQFRKEESYFGFCGRLNEKRK